MGLSWTWTFGSGFSAQELEYFVGSFCIVKLCLALAVLPLLMYTLQWKFGKNGFRDTRRTYLTVNQESGLKESCETVEENATKKRRRRKKKPNAQNSEKDEYSNDGNKEEEHSDPTGAKPRQLKVNKRNTGADVSSKRSENTKASSRVEQAKDARGRGDSGVTSRSVNRRVETSDDVSWTVREVKAVVNMAVCSKKPGVNAMCLVLNENTVCRDRRQIYEKSPRNVKKADDISVKELEKNDSDNFNNGATTQLTSSSHKSNMEQSVTARKQKKKKKKCQAHDSRERELDENGGDNFDSKRTIPWQTPSQKSKTKQSLNVREHQEMECKADEDAGYTETDCDQRQFSGDSSERMAGNNGNPDTSAAVNHRRRSTTSRRNSFDRSSEKGTRESDLPENLTVGRTRRTSPDRSEQKEPGAKYFTATPSDNRTFNCTSENDLRESEISETHRYPADNRRRRGSSDDTLDNDPSGHEHPENHKHPADNQKRRMSWGRTSRNSGSEPLENRQRCSTENFARRRSFGRTSESFHKGSDENHSNNHSRRRKSCDNSSDNKRHAGRSELSEDNRHHQKENQARRRSFDRTSKNDLGGSHPHCPTKNRSPSESKKLDEYEERKSEALVERSPGVHMTVLDAEADCFSTTRSVETTLPTQAVDQRDTDESPHSPFFIDPEVRERIAKPRHPVRMPDKPFLHMSYQDGSERYDDNIGPNKSLVGGLFGRKWREKMEREKLKQESEEVAEEKRRQASFMHPGDNICPTFMIWGVCHRGDHCPLRHPPGRYLERPPRRMVSPERAPEQPNKDPNSYASILEKINSSEPEEFFNEALVYEAETAVEANGKSYSNALVSARHKHDTSKVPVAKNTYEEAWPSLGCTVQRQNMKASKERQGKQGTPNVRQAWTNQKGSRISEENTKTTVDKLQVANDRVIANELQAEEYSQLNENDDYSDYQEDELNEESYYLQEQETNAENDSSSELHLETKVRELDHFNSSQKSPVIIEDIDRSTREGESPTPNPVSSGVCDICMDRPKDATLVCGHRFCYQCALQMRLDERVCAICRRCIVSVIKTYN